MLSPLLKRNLVELADKKMAEDCQRRAAFVQKFMESLDQPEKHSIDLSDLGHHLGQARATSSELYDTLIRLLDETEIKVGREQKFDEKKLHLIWNKDEVKHLYKKLFEHLADFAEAGRRALDGDEFSSEAASTFQFMQRVEDWFRKAAREMDKALCNPSVRFNTQRVIMVVDNAAELDHQLDRMLRNSNPEWEEMPNWMAWNVRGHVRALLSCTSIAQLNDSFPTIGHL